MFLHVTLSAKTHIHLSLSFSAQGNFRTATSSWVTALLLLFLIPPKMLAFTLNPVSPILILPQVIPFPLLIPLPLHIATRGFYSEII